MPSIGYPTPRVAPDALPGVRVSTNAPDGAFGVGSAVDLSGPTKLAASIVDEQRQEAEETQVVAADNQLHDLKASIQRDTLQNFRGINALGAAAAAKTAWEKGVAEIRQNTPGGDHVQAIVARRAATHWGDIVSNVESHADSEYRQAQTHEFATAVDNRTANAVSAFNDPVKRNAAIEEGKGIISIYAKRAGMSPDETRHRLEEFASATHASVIERMVSEHQDVPAEQYLKEHRSELLGKDLIGAERLTGEASVLGEGQRNADRILKSTVTDAVDPTPQTLLSALAEAEKIENPRVRDQTAHQIRQHFADLATADREAKQAAFTQASAIVEKTGSFDAVPLKVRQAMSPEENSALQHREDQIRHPKEFGDPETYFHLLNLASVSPQSRQQFLSENILSYKGLSSSERQRLLNLQRQMSVSAEHGAATAQMHANVAARKDAEDLARLHDGLARAATITDATAREAEIARVKQHYADVHIARTAVAPSGGDAVPPAPTVSAAHPLQGLLAPASGPVLTKPTPRQLQDAATNPHYAAYLRSMHIDLPTTLPAPPQEKKK